jgi:hypothetical protein
MLSSAQARVLHRNAARGSVMSQEGQRELDRALNVLEREAPDRVARAVHWLRSPASRKVRIPLGLLFIVGGLLWFLPVLGIELLPIGLLLIAQDVPFLKKPVGRGMLWLEGKWLRRKQRKGERRGTTHARSPAALNERKS